ncbi:MAG: hypothetical protein M3525_10715 [Acidobacteriota bacterium]|nr:hypothetical protein [Acidobacteriota bacterium]
MKQKFFSPACAALLLLFAVAVSAQSPGKILKQAARAIGGEKVWKSQKSFRKKGTITRLRDGASGTILIQGAQPNFYNTSFNLNGFETEYGFNGKSGWTRNSRDGLKTLTGEASRDFQVEAAFRNNLWLNYKKEKAKIIAGGQSSSNGKPADLLIYTTAKGVPVKLFFDKASGLLVREEIRAGETTKVFNYGDYRKVDGRSEPFSIKQTIGEDVYEIKLDQITRNAPVAAAEFDFPKISNEPLPDIPALLKSLQENEDKVDEILENYSYTEKITSRGFDKDGVLHETSSRTFQLSFYKGNRMTRLVERSDQPLTPNEQADEDKKVEKRVAEIDRKIAKKEAKAASQSKNKAEEDDDRRISIAELLRASNLINPRREIFRGREVIVFDFEPNPNFDFKNTESFLKLFGKTMGVMWIDARDKQVARLEAVLADNFKIGGGVLLNLSKGASFALEQERVNDEIWLPSVADVNLPLRVLLVAGFNFNQVVKFYNYRKFVTEVKDAKVDEIKQP